MLLLLLTLTNKILALAPTCYGPDLTPRIIGGTQASQREFPFLAAVRTTASLCGGSLIAPGWVLTAAHCGASEYVVLGKSNLDTVNDPCEERINVQARYPHPLYDAYEHTNDIQLLKLDTPSTYNPIKLWNGVGTTGAVGASLTVAGWGTLSEDSQTASNFLMKVTVPVQSNQKCTAQYGDVITSSMLCAGLDAGGKDSCTGDSGGPLFARDTTSVSSFIQAAIVSFGMGCGQANAYGVYTRVSPYLDWICNTAGVCGSSKPTAVPTRAPTGVPTRVPTKFPTFVPTRLPTGVPTRVPTRFPTFAPTRLPSAAPTLMPTRFPTGVPTRVPSRGATGVPTRFPSGMPTFMPTRLPTGFPSVRPTPVPTNRITPAPTAPTGMPTTSAPVSKPPTNPPTAPCRTCVWCLSFLPMCPPPTPARPAPTPLPTRAPTPLPTAAPPTAAPSATRSAPIAPTTRQQVMFPQNNLNQQLGNLFGLQMLLGNRQLEQGQENGKSDERQETNDNQRNNDNDDNDDRNNRNDRNDRNNRGKGNSKDDDDDDKDKKNQNNRNTWTPPTPEPPRGRGEVNGGATLPASWGPSATNWGQQQQQPQQQQWGQQQPSLPASWGQQSRGQAQVNFPLGGFLG